MITGKTHAQEAVLAANRLAQLVPVTGDDYREYHPDHPWLAEHAPLEMPAATAPVSGGIIRLALDHALAGRYSVLLEGTFRDPAMVTATAARFAGAGYRVEVVAVATPAAESRLSAQRRALGDGGRFGRWTPPGAHEAALTGSPLVVAALEEVPAVSRVQVYSRQRLLYDNERGAGGAWRDTPRAAEALRAEQARPLTAAQAAGWLARYHDVFNDARSRPGYLGPATVPAYRLLQQDAASLIPVAGADPKSDLAALRREHNLRQAVLAHLAPPHAEGRRRSRTNRFPRPPSPPLSSWNPPSRQPPGPRL
ncbi:MAG: zeta toxin family protein [Bifidobacteriaceae bacterium]|nr:zeta toxin family protein [Bifidobacteriaceae bacterium]